VRDALSMHAYEQMYIDGQWVAPHGTGTLEVHESATEQVMATVPAGDATDAERAIDAAAAAFPAWSALSVEERCAYLDKIVAGLSARMSEIGETVAKEVGMPVKLSTMIQAGLPIDAFAKAAAFARSFEWETEVGNTLVVREPIGVVGAITPWNYPLYQISLKVAPALAAGNTVVLKPSEVAPVNAFMLAEIVHEAGLPAGVFNLVTGVGPVVGEAIASSPKVDMVSFTGSTRAGKRVSELASETVKKVHLELGGKSANVILDDADLAKAVADGVGKCFLNSGQTCSALTRMIVPRSKLAEVEQIAAATAAAFTPGDPLADGTRLGPLVSSAQRDRVLTYIDKGIAEGATLLAGGTERPAGLDSGYFVQPTVFSNVTPDMTIAREEIFGPVLSILPYDTEDEAVAIANDSVYGLAGGVWAGTQERALGVARRLRTGQVEVNGGAFNPDAPFGGYKQSGVGRERGVYGLDEFLETKALMR
jgi:aldehyde dehydrogenase (NAD+)